MIHLDAAAAAGGSSAPAGQSVAGMPGGAHSELGGYTAFRSNFNNNMVIHPARAQVELTSSEHSRKPTCRRGVSP